MNEIQFSYSAFASEKKSNPSLKRNQSVSQRDGSGIYAGERLMRSRLKNIPPRVYIRYGLLTIPGTLVLILVMVVVGNWVPIPVWLQGILVFLWIAKEAVLFPFIWRAYDHSRTEVSRSMIGQRGLTRQSLAPAGYIQVQGELWKAEKMPGEPPIEKDMWVRVIKMEGLKLFVLPEEKDDRRPGTDDGGQRTDDRERRA